MSKQNLILIHGLRGNHLGLAELADYLKPYFNVFVPDIPPAGNKSLKDRLLSMAYYTLRRIKG